MNVLIVGGSGLIGGDAALYLKSQGHSITIMARSRPTVPVLAEFDFLQSDYINDDMDDGRLIGFDWLLFSAAADIRNIPLDGSITPENFYSKSNDKAVPRFFTAAKNAGIKRSVYIGTFYPQVAPQQIGKCPYVTSRHNTDVAVRALSTDSFGVCCLNPPFVIGHIPGMNIPYVQALVSYVKGQLPDLPVFSPVGGSNFITSRSIAQAVLGALENGESGKSYLIGDENHLWKDYLEMWFTIAGNTQTLKVKDDDHPIFPNAIMFAGAGATVSFESEHCETLRYDRQQVKAVVKEILAAYS